MVLKLFKNVNKCMLDIEPGLSLRGSKSDKIDTRTNRGGCFNIYYKHIKNYFITIYEYYNFSLKGEIPDKGVAPPLPKRVIFEKSNTGVETFLEDQSNNPQPSNPGSATSITPPLRPLYPPKIPRLNSSLKKQKQ